MIDQATCKTEVKDSDLAVVVHDNVPRMNIGMDKSLLVELGICKQNRSAQLMELLRIVQAPGRARRIGGRCRVDTGTPVHSEVASAAEYAGISDCRANTSAEVLEYVGLVA
jgi:hypothetical protein